MAARKRPPYRTDRLAYSRAARVAARAQPLADLGDHGAPRRNACLLVVHDPQGAGSRTDAVWRPDWRGLGGRPEPSAWVERTHLRARVNLGDRAAVPGAVDAGHASGRIPARVRWQHPDPFPAVGADANDHARRLSLRRDLADARNAWTEGARHLDRSRSTVCGLDLAVVVSAAVCERKPGGWVRRTGHGHDGKPGLVRRRFRVSADLE